ncbi:MAG: PQQ-dependent sugar dehydrogenase, partial [bacterium]|nr:PQQ-dependent sugar dehydrogenase [bacterium]
MIGQINKHVKIMLLLAAVPLLFLSLQGCHAPTPDTVNVGLQQVAGGMTAPVVLTHADDGSGRLFIADQVGTIRILPPGGTLLDQPFLNITSRIVPLNPNYDERGLLGLAFHPDYRNNGRFFVYYSAPLRQGAPAGWDHTNVVSEF